MKQATLLIITTLLLAFGAQTAAAQNGYDLFQKALVKERAVGNVEEALRLYQRIVKEFGSDHALAAKAQLRLGLLYQRLGRKAEAQQAFQQVLSHYSDQADAVRQARTSLARIGSAAKAMPPTLTVRQVWADTAVDPQGRPLPDGKAFVFTDWETGDIALRELATGKTRRLTNKGSFFQSQEFGITPVPSPDGKQVAYYWFNKDKQTELRLIGIEGAAPRVLYRNEEIVSPTPVQWSPDGKQVLAIFVGKDSNNHLALVSVADGAARIIKSLGPYYPLNVSFSPDGRYIAYDFPPHEEATSFDIYVLSVADGRETQLEAHPANDFPLGWMPDGKRLMFASDRTGALGAWVMKVADGRAQGAPELLRPETGLIFPIGFAGNSSYYFGLRTGMQDVYAATVDWAAGKLITTAVPVSQQYAGANTSADWSPNGQELAFVTRRGLMTGETGWQTLSIHSFETSKTRELKLKLKYFDRPRWAPDGRSVLVFGQDRKSKFGIYRVDVTSGDVSVLAQSEGNTRYFQPAWTRDGKAVIFQRNDFSANLTTLVIKDIEINQEREIYRATKLLNTTYLALAPDGSQLAFVVYDQATMTSTLKLLPIGNGEARDLFIQSHDPKAPFYFYGLTWMPDGRELILLKGSIRSEEPNTEVWRLSVAGGAPQKFTIAMARVRDLRIHPDGKRLAFTSGNQKVELWVMENIPPAPPARRASVSRR